MNELNEEQIKEFWEWCGFYFIKSRPNVGWHYAGFEYYGEQLPSIDLSNLFKYAMPKLYNDMVYGRLKGGEFDESDYIGLIVGWAESVARDKQDPALALFWALDKVLEMDRKGSTLREQGVTLKEGRDI